MDAFMADLVEKALVFAAMAHRSQTRKGTNIPYITHPYAVGMILQKAKCPDEVIAAGILHDTLEDTGTTYEELEAAFGAKVAKLVVASSEADKSLPWEIRKQQSVEKLKNADREEIQVIVADKLHNLKSIRADLQWYGDDVWDRFNRGKREQHWYYAGIVKALAPRKRETGLIRELEKEVKAVFGSLQVLSREEIDLLFSCAYLCIDDVVGEKLAERQLLHFAKNIVQEADNFYRQLDERIYAKLDDLRARGIQFETNTEGPFILAAFCVTLQNRMQWTDQELFKHFKRNKSKL